MLRPTLFVAAFAAASPVFADTDLDALRAEIRDLKAAYETRIQALETRLQQAETRTETVATQTAIQAQAAPEPQSRTRSSFNPDVSLILQGRYAHLEDRGERGISGFMAADGHGHGGGDRGFSVDGSELVLSASIDPYFRGYLNAVLADGEVEVEEAWAQTTGLGQGVSIKGGRFKSGIGYQNEQHPHAWDFATNNLVYEVLFGEGYAQDGVQFKWLAPTDTFLEFGAELGNGSAFPGTRNDSNGADSVTLFGHTGGDVGVSNSWRAGLSWLRAKPRGREFESHDINEIETAGDFSGKSRTWLADFVWKWAPNGNPTQQNFKFAAEYFQRKESGTLACDDADPAAPSLCAGGLAAPYLADQSGFYAQAVYQFMPRWRAGYRYDQLFRDDVLFNGADAGSVFESLADYDPKRHSLMLDYSPSEFSRLRLQYTLDKAMEGVDENQFYVQYIYSLGSHGAHKF
ncbi:TonB-dependent receptor [Thiobacillus sp.]|uniref:TonB-dependent receptor n=1 Tax=Thiobacillus sp. TaxID=924 RepID=UPI0025F1B86A|nr:TonB-dependent receptor [Thiobacillus sp.]